MCERCKRNLEEAIPRRWPSEEVDGCTAKLLKPMIVARKIRNQVVMTLFEWSHMERSIYAGCEGDLVDNVLIPADESKNNHRRSIVALDGTKSVR